MTQLRVAVIADHDRVPRFALAALNRLDDVGTVTLFSCTNTRPAKRRLRHAAYYALNLLSVRNAWTRSVPLASGTKPIGETVVFESGWDGAWQTLPPAVVDRLAGFDIVLKFGMGLLRVPEAERLPAPILSYHHGDPDHFRGRPAGFWEMAKGERVVGQIVQAIGNRLDAGRVLAFAETRVLAHSYRATLVEAYRHSPLILAAAVRNALAGRSIDKPCSGRNYRLPGNGRVIAFVAAMAARWTARLFYGLLVEKKWQVSTAPAPAALVPALADGSAIPAPDGWTTVRPLDGYVFYADPFFSEDPPGLLVEALRASTGRGEIVHVGAAGQGRVSPEGGHFSYPGALVKDGRQIVVPETAQWLPATAFRIEDGAMRPLQALDIEGDPHIVDPTLVEEDGRLYLFGGLRSANALCLWSAPSLEGRFELHPASPVLISPKGARMGGGFLRAEGRLFRFGQDFRFGYGDGLFAFEVEALTPTDYRERPVGHLRFADRRGPHTLNVKDGTLLFDWYRERLSPGAGVRRALAALSARRRSPAPRAAPPARATDPRPSGTGSSAG